MRMHKYNRNRNKIKQIAKDYTDTEFILTSDVMSP